MCPPVGWLSQGPAKPPTWVRPAALFPSRIFVFVFIVPTEIPADIDRPYPKGKKMNNRTKQPWQDFFPLDVSGVTVSCAGLPEPAEKDGQPVAHPFHPDEAAFWLPVNIGLPDGSSVRRSVKVPASQVTDLTTGVEIVLGGLTGTAYPSKNWAAVSLAASVVTSVPGGKTIPARPKA